MAGEEVRQFSANAHREIQRDHTRLKAMVTNLARRQRVYDSLDSEPVKTITGVTSTSSSYPSYPTSGNTYVVKLNDYYFTEAAGTQTRTSAGVSSRFVIARTWDGSSVAEGTPVICDLIWCHGQGYRWWIRPAAGAGGAWPMIGIDLLGDLVYTGGTTITTAKPGGYRVAAVWGDTDQISITVNGSRSAYTDWAFSIAEAGSYVWLWHWLIPTASFSGGANVTYTTSTPSAGTSHTHTVDIPNQSTAMLKLQLERQAGGSGSWDFGVPAYPADQGLVRKLVKMYGIDSTLNVSHSVDAVIAESTLTAGDRWRLQLSASVSAIATASEWSWPSFSAAPCQLVLIRIGDAVTPTSY